MSELPNAQELFTQWHTHLGNLRSKASEHRDMPIDPDEVAALRLMQAAQAMCMVMAENNRLVQELLGEVRG